MKRTGFKRPQLERRPAPPALPLQRPVNVATFTGIVRPWPKTIEHRRPRLLDLAMDQRCLLRIPNVCMGNTETTVACHSNMSVHGKGGTRKADDQYSVWGCMACHRWLDQDRRPSYEEKVEAFLRAHQLQVLEWRKIAADPARSAADKAAVTWALDLIEQMPVIEVTVPDVIEIEAREIEG